MIIKIKEFYGRVMDFVMPRLTFIIAGTLLLIYFLGFLATGIDKTVKGFDLNPFVAVPTLFSPSGRALVVLLLLVPALLWVVFELRNGRFAGTTLDERGFRIMSNGTYGTAEEMDKYRMKEKFHCVPEARVLEAEGDVLGIKNGVVVSRPAKSYHNRNVACYGSSGSMKSRAISRNKIIGCCRRGESIVVTDPKGELFGDTAVWLRKNGYTVRTLNFVTMEKSNGWNFMEDALKDCAGDGDELEVVEQMAHVIIQNTNAGSPGQAKDDFWDKGERGLLKAIILYQYYTWKQNPTNPLAFSWAYKFLHGNDVETMKQKFEALNRNMPMNAATAYFNIFLLAGERVCPNIHFGLLSRLNVFINQRVQEITGRNEIDLELPAKKKCAYFVISPDQHSTYDFLSCLFFTLFFIRIIKFADTKTVDRQCPIAVNLILDEFPSIGEIPDFAKKMATVRSRNVNITILFQSIPQLTERYPAPQHFGILSNCDHTVFLGTADPVTAEFISTRAGEATIMVETVAEAHSKFNPTHFTPDQRESTGSGKRMIKTVDEVLMMEKDDPFAAMVIMRGQPVLMCQKFDYTRDPDSKQWEPLSMDDYDPRDPFWFDPEEGQEGGDELWKSPGQSLRPEAAAAAPEPAAEPMAAQGGVPDVPEPMPPQDNILVPDVEPAKPGTPGPAADAVPAYEMRDSERHAANSFLQARKKETQEAVAERYGEPEVPATPVPPAQSFKPGQQQGNSNTSFKSVGGSQKPPSL